MTYTLFDTPAPSFQQRKETFLYNLRGNTDNIKQSHELLIIKD